MSRLSRLVLLAIVLSSGIAGCTDSPTEPSPAPSVQYSITELRLGTGATATSGRAVTVNYTIWLYSATASENKGSRIENGTITFTIGAGNVIQGLSAGVTGMRVEGLRRLIVPPSLAFGAAGSGPVPPNAPVVFDVELLNVQ